MLQWSEGFLARPKYHVINSVIDAVGGYSYIIKVDKFVINLSYSTLFLEAWLLSN
jgi:hypothetical protein